MLSYRVDMCETMSEGVEATTLLLRLLPVHFKTMEHCFIRIGVLHGCFPSHLYLFWII